MRSEDGKRQDSHSTETVQSYSGNGVSAGRWTPHDVKQIMIQNNVPCREA